MSHEREKTTRAVSSTLATLTFRALGIGAQFALFYAVTQLESLAFLGRFALASAIWSVSRALGPLGMDQVLLRELPLVGEALVPVEGRVFRRSWLFGAVVSLVVLLIFSQGWVFTYSLEETFSIVVGVLLFSTLGLRTSQLRGRGLGATAQVGESFVAPVFTLALYVGGNIVLESGPDVFAASAVGVALASIVNRGLLSSVREKSLSSTEGTRFSDEHVAALMASSGVIFKGQLANAMSVRGSVMLLSALTIESEVGIYESAYRLASLSALATWAVGVTFSPKFSRVAHDAESKRLRRLVRDASALASVPALCLLLVWIAGGRGLLSVFGPEYESAYLPLLSLGIGFTVNAIGGVAGTALLMTGGERIVSRASIAQLLIVTLGFLGLGSSIGAAEAACVVAVAQLIRDGSCLVGFWGGGQSSVSA